MRPLWVSAERLKSTCTQAIQDVVKTVLDTAVVLDDRDFYRTMQITRPD